MPYTNTVLSTSLDTTYNAIAPNYTSFSSLQLITGIDLSAQLEVERVFASDRLGSTLTVTNFMNNADVKLSDKRAVYVIPITRCTLNATTSKITAIDLPASGNVYNYTYYLISDPTNANALTIQVPAIVQGSALTIRRKTVTNQSLVSWVDGSKLTSAQLNLQTKQLLYLAQEMSDTLNTELARSNDITSQIADGAVTPTKISSTTDPWSFYGTIQTVAPTANLHATTRLYTLDKFFQHGVMTKDDVAPTSSAVDILETAATAGNSGLWFNPKNGTINLWAGNAWVTVAGTPVTTANLVSTNTVQTLTAAKTFAAGTVVPFTQIGTGAVARTVDAKLKDTVSVKDFGAVGDGVADDTAAIQAALDSLKPGNQNEKGSILYFPNGIYKITSTIYITLDHATITLFGDAKVTLFAALPDNNYVIDVDYATGATANFVTFNMYSISINDYQAPYQVKNGIRTQRVIASKFVQCEFQNLNIAVNMGNDSNLNTFDTCMWRGNNYGWKSVSGNANNNTFLNCQWRYHSNTAFDSTGTGGNLILGGDFEPLNACPVIIASDLTMTDTRVERNIQGQWINVGDSNDLQIPAFADGGGQPVPFMQITGINNRIKILGGMAAQIADFTTASHDNEIEIVSDVQAMMSPATSVLIHDKGTRNILKTNASIQSTTSSSFPEALIDNLLVSPDLTTWVATNCTVTLISGQKYSILTTGGTATLTQALPVGSYGGLRMAISMQNFNASGQINISLASAATAVACGDYPTNAERRLVLGTFDYLTPTVYVNPTVTITMAGTGAGGLGYIWNLRMSASGRVPN